VLAIAGLGHCLFGHLAVTKTAKFKFWPAKKWPKIFMYKTKNSNQLNFIKCYGVSKLSIKKFFLYPILPSISTNSL